MARDITIYLAFAVVEVHGPGTMALEDAPALTTSHPTEQAAYDWVKKEVRGLLDGFMPDERPTVPPLSEWEEADDSFARTWRDADSDLFVAIWPVF